MNMDNETKWAGAAGLLDGETLQSLQKQFIEKAAVACALPPENFYGHAPKGLPNGNEGQKKKAPH